MTATTATVVCPQCASTVDSAESFCPVCGDFLGWREEPAAEAPAVVVLPDAPVPAEDPLARFREAAAAADQAAEEAQREASRAQVRLERARRRSASARRRVERLQEELPAAEERARAAERAAQRAAAGARRAASAAAGSGPARRAELRDRAREARRAEARARTAALQAAESAATLSGVLQGARGEVAAAPGEVSAAQRARDVARSEATRAVRAATAAAAELALQERLLQLRATPRRVVALPDAEQRAMREQAEQEAAAAAREAERRAEAAERRQRRRAEREDERRDQAEQQSDDREIGEAREGAGTAERAAKTAERAARRPRRPAGVTVGSWDDVVAGEAAAPVDLEAEAAAVLRAGAPGDGDASVPDGGALRAGLPRTRPLPLLDQDEEPGAITPVEVRRRVRRQVLPLVPPDDGPLTCPSCSVGNAEGRHLCRSCGVVLRQPEPEPPPRPAWWRRLLRLGPPRPPADRFIPAGARPVPGGNRDTAAAVRRARVGGAAALRDGDSLRVAAPLVATAVVLVLALLAALTPLGGALRDALTGSGDRVRARAGLTETPLVPLATRASSTGRTSAPALAVDGDPLTTWVAGRPPGAGERLGITLYEPADVVAVRLTVAPGAGRPRPASVTVHSLGAPPVVLRLRDTLEPQRLPLRLSGVRDVRIRLDDLYPGAVSGLSAGFAEVQLLTRSPRRVADLVER